MDKFISLISSLRWQDIVDIGLVSYILFRFYILFRGTNAFRVLIGMTILWFFQQLAVSVGLIVTSWVVQGIIALGAFIIIVVFRNEIRSVLQASHFCRPAISRPFCGMYRLKHLSAQSKLSSRASLKWLHENAAR